ncbi:MAG: hypothetical protein NT067_00545 [Candidatus Diapherotrites archaeon]|nr:hypothetical protein [Candidatus Diapherotrites archaeon]
MGKLETVRDVFSIIRDALIIILVIVVIMLGLTIIGFVNSIDPKSLSCANMVNTVMSGDLSPILGGAGGSQAPTAKYTPTQEMAGLMSEIEKAAGTGDKQTALAKLDTLRALCSSAGMTDAVQKIDELKMAVEQENYMQALATGSTLKKMFGQ